MQANVSEWDVPWRELTWAKNRHDYTYLGLLDDLVRRGRKKKSRARLADGSRPDTLSLFGEQIRFDLRESFPLITTKKVWWEGVRTELVWMLRGDTNVKYLEDRKVKIWSAWASEHGDLGPVYGHQWRKWGEGDYGCTWDPGVDQIANLVAGIKDVIADPNASIGRRLILTAWNPMELPPKAPPACHTLAQFEVYEGELSCHLYMRSADSFLGVPFNCAQYALLTSILAKVTGLRPGDLYISFGDVHLYENHLDQVKEQLGRIPFAPPTLTIKDRPGIMPWEFDPEDFTIAGYECHPALPGEVAV